MEQVKSKITKPVGQARKKCMQKSSKKLQVQFVAYGQIVIGALSLILALGMIVYGISFTVVVAEDPDQALQGDFKNLDPLYRNSTGIISIVWMGIAIFAVDTILQLWASTRLLQATESGISYSDAMKRIRFWWSYTIISTVMGSAPFLCSDYYGVGILFVLMRFSFLFHVWSFRKAIQQRAKDSRAAFQAAGSPYAIQIVIPE